MTLQDKLNEMVRDFTAVIPKSKSEVRKRLMDFSKDILKDLEKEIKREIPVFKTQTAGGKRKIVLLDDIIDLIETKC